MNKTRKIIVAALASAGIALAAAPAFAFKGDCGGGGHGYMMDDGPRAERMKEYMEFRHERLRKELKLTAAQEPAWKAFSEQAGPKQFMTKDDWAAMEKMNAPERMEAMLKFSKKRQEAMSERLEALKTFYATLTPEQQKIFDKHASGPMNSKNRR